MHKLNFLFVLFICLVFCDSGFGSASLGPILFLVEIIFVYFPIFHTQRIRLPPRAGGRTTSGGSTPAILPRQSMSATPSRRGSAAFTALSNAGGVANAQTAVSIGDANVTTPSVYAPQDPRVPMPPCCSIGVLFFVLVASTLIFLFALEGIVTGLVESLSETRFWLRTDWNTHARWCFYLAKSYAALSYLLFCVLLITINSVSIQTFLDPAWGRNSQNHIAIHTMLGVSFGIAAFAHVMAHWAAVLTIPDDFFHNNYNGTLPSQYTNLYHLNISFPGISGWLMLCTLTTIVFLGRELRKRRCGCTTSHVHYVHGPFFCILILYA